MDRKKRRNARWLRTPYALKAPPSDYSRYFPAARRAYRELIVTTPGLGDCISGAILCDETIRQQKKGGTPFV
jgi:hypothetical protein